VARQRAERIGEDIMGGFSVWHWLVVGIIILLLFGKGRFSDMMGDVAKGLKSFKKGLSEEEEAAAATPPPGQARIEQQAAVPTVAGEEVPTDRRV
jgi:sec-independent protein translocase protein TatA